MMEDVGVSVLIFPLLSSTSKVARAVDQGRSRLSLFWDFCEAAPFVDCSGDWEVYLESRGKTRRNSWLYYERRALKGGCTFEDLSSWEDIEAQFDAILAVEASGWKGQQRSAIDQNPALRNFYRSLCEELAGLGKLRVFLLRRAGRIIAFQICTLDAGTLTCLKIGYLEEFARESPGQVLQLHIVRWAFSRSDVHVFDMLGPASETKLKWATGVEELSTLYVFRRSIGGAIAKLRWELGPKAKKWLTRRLDARGQSVKNKAGLKQDSAD
jgi:CelD/BcsL family acetyltransferase involved in cellulose biosynthesis